MKNNNTILNKTAVESVDKVIEHLSENPIFNINHIINWTGFTPRGAYKVVDRLLKIGIINPHGETKDYGQEWIFRESEIQNIVDANRSNSETINIVSVEYDKTGDSTKIDELGMREMQKRAYAHRNSKKLLIKAPPASGKSRALMFLALDKIRNQNLNKVIIAVPERSIGASFSDVDLTKHGFFEDWHIDSRNNLTNEDGLNERSMVGAFMRFMDGDDKILLCTHATLRFAFEEIPTEKFNNCVLAIDEFHHTSTSETSRLGQLLHDVMNGSNVQIIAMTGSYFRGDAVPILTAEDEEEFDKVTYTYYEQLNGYTYLKTLGIGYHFYTGSYLDDGALSSVLDTHKKTIIHIPNVNSKESTLVGKLEEVAKIFDIIGTWIKKDSNGIDHIITKDGRELLVANLVDDETEGRRKLVKYLGTVARDDISGVDIIIALGMAKEGFDWPFCEHALTIGYRSSLTEIVQIIGRCTRDSYNKSHSQFTNLIVQPNGSNDDITVSVNNMLKAITVSLLMEQVLAPSFTFTPRPSDGRKALPGEIFVKGLKQPSSDKVRHILETDLDDLTASTIQNEQIQKAAAQGLTGGYVNHLQSKIIREMHPELTDEEVEITRQYLAANLAFKTAEPVRSKDGDIKFIRLANRFVKIDELDINLIDSINPFHHAFEVISKKVGVDTFKIIQDTIAGNRIDMKVEDALALVPQIKAFVVAHNGQHPSLNSEDKNEKLLAQAKSFLTAQRAKYEREKLKREIIK
jgi:superfamily II DNA or RNA helicase